MSIVITGGGTGGHLAVAKAIKNELNQRGIKPIFIGSVYGQDRAWFEDDEGFEQKYFFDVYGVMNKSIFGKIVSLAKIFRFTVKCGEIFAKHNVQKVFSVGGYSAAPASFAALFFKKELFIHEQNAKMGKLNSLLQTRAKEVFSSYSELSPVKDYPVELCFFENARLRERIRNVIFLGGSQGASFINEFAMSVAGELNKRGIKIIHQSGAKEYEKVKRFYRQNGIEADLFDFAKDLVHKLKIADFAISRAGASTLWELSASCLPALFIPYPYAAANHQRANAEFLKKNSLAFVKDQNELKKEDLFDILDKDISQISKGLCEIIKQGGAKKIVERLLNESIVC